MRYLMMTLASAVLSVSPLCGCSEAVSKKLTIECPSLVASPEQQQETAAGVHMSSWGKQVHGLALRVTTQRSIEQSMPLEVTVELRCVAEHLPAGVKALNKFLWTKHFVLELTNAETNERFVVETDDPTRGMPPPRDRGDHSIPLDGSPIDPVELTFRLVRLRDELVPGPYECRVGYAPRAGPHRWWAGTREEWEARGYWSGATGSGSWRLEILPETPKTRSFALPKRLRCEKQKLEGPGMDPISTVAVTYSNQDADEVELAVRNGHVVGAYYYRDGARATLRGGPPVPDDINPIDRWHGGDHEGRDVAYTIELFESCEPVGHFWNPRACGYKVLWKKTFVVKYPEHGTGNGE